MEWSAFRGSMSIHILGVMSLPNDAECYKLGAVEDDEYIVVILASIYLFLVSYTSCSPFHFRVRQGPSTGTELGVRLLFFSCSVCR
jgi:hypothetical protein